MRINFRLPAITEEKKQMWSRLLELSWPSIMEQLLIMFVGMITMILIGRSIGPDATAAVGLVNSLFMFIQAVFAGLSVGSTVLVARLKGEGDQEGVRSAARQGIIMGLIVSVVLMVPSYVFSAPLLRLFASEGTNANIFEIAITYLRILVLSLPFLILNIIIGGVLRGVGDTKFPMLVSLVVNVINLVLGLWFIFGLNWGISGAGWAAFIARVIGFILPACMIFGWEQRIGIRLRQGFKLDMPMIRRTLYVGFPASMEQIIMQGGFVVFNILLLRMAEGQAAGYNVVMSINSLAFMPAMGLSMATSTLAGHSLGEGNVQRAERYINYSLYLGMAGLAIVGLLMYIFAEPLCWLYTTDESVVIIARDCLRILAFTPPILAILVIVSAGLRAAGDVKYVMYTSIIGIWVFRLGVTQGMESMFSLGAKGAIISVLVDFAVRGAAYWLRYRKGNWKTIKI